MIHYSRELYSSSRSNQVQESYYRSLPNYILARCPICQTEFSGNVDTHSIGGWMRTFPSTFGQFGEKALYHTKCLHFTAIQSFINLNGHFPVEMESFEAKDGDIPCVSPELLANPTSVSVIHSLPICVQQNGIFVPKYSAYVLTYFAENPRTVRKQVFDAMNPTLDGSNTVQEDSYFESRFFLSSKRIIDQPLVGNLLHWVKIGKLQWLDLDDQKLPLKNIPIDRFPYVNIQGFGQPYIYRKRPKPRWFWQQKNWHPNGDIRDWSESRILYSQA